MTKTEPVFATRRTPASQRFPAPDRSVVAVGVLVALWCVGFAAISVWFEVTNFFGTGQYAQDATAISVMNWFVAVLKLVGAGAALLAVHPRLMAARTVGTLLWAAFATLTVYVVGGIAEAVGMLTGVAGDADRVDTGSIAYLLAFLLAATGFGILAISHARRAGLSTRVKVLGACGAPFVLGTVLVILPAILKAVGLLTAT